MSEIIIVLPVMLVFCLIVLGILSFVYNRHRTLVAYLRFEQALDDFRMEFGNALLPVLETTLSAINEWLDTNKDELESLGG